MDRSLGRFVHDTRHFRMKMRMSGAIVSGGLALQYFSRLTWKESDMDVFVNKHNKGADAIVSYLTKFEGYEKSRKQRVRYSTDYCCFGKVLTFVRKNEYSKTVVQVIATEEPPVWSVISTFYGRRLCIKECFTFVMLILVRLQAKRLEADRW